MVSELPYTWLQWLPLAEFWYNTSHHSSIRMTPFEAFYGYPPPIHIPYFPHDTVAIKVDRC